jgi:tetratricopeptide (TPR) repeat protein
MDPEDARANNGVGVVLGQLGKPDAAIPYLQKATRIDENFFEAYYNPGVLQARANRFNEAVDAWQNNIRICPRFSQRHENLGDAFYLQARFTDSLTQLHLALGEEPNRLFALNLAASLLATCPDSSIRNGAEALALADRAEQLTGGKNSAILDTFSEALAENGRFAQAIEVEQDALELAEKHSNPTLETKLKAHLASNAANAPIREAPNHASF